VKNRGLKQILKVKSNVKNIAVFIGPEGGFTDEEVNIASEKGAFQVTLGPRILRTETAGFTCLAIIMYELGDIGGEPWQK
jgi:16S rRNA (uracil1498-N3)-methyltransferase